LPATHFIPPAITTPDGETKLLLHTCCAPCSSAIIECLLYNGITPTVYYCNPNIFPKEEYEIRKNECSRYAEELGLEIVDADYDHDNWLCAMKGLENEPERGHRCMECFKLRLLRTARYAHDHGYALITTTLASSRWKSLEQINEAGEWAVGQPGSEGVKWWAQNWRKGGLQPRRQEIIREMNFYNQLYCGCEFSRSSMEINQKR